jgi:hypothetical protein
MHEHHHRLGHVLMEGASVVDLLPSDYRASCLQCGASASVRSLQRATEVHRVCRSCFAKLAVRFEGVDIVALTPAPPARVGDAAAADAAARGGKPKRKDDGAIQVGLPLPDQGACRHYRKSYRWCAPCTDGGIVLTPIRGCGFRAAARRTRVTNATTRRKTTRPSGRTA